MAMESRRDGHRLAGTPESLRSPAYRRHEQGEARPRRAQPIAAALEAELATARAAAQALALRPRSRCRVSRVQTCRWGVIESVDEVLGLLLLRPARVFVGMHFSGLIAGPERRIFAERAKVLLDSPAGTEWETRLIAPGARVGVSVAISVERSESSLSWYIRDLTELRRAQARVMELEALRLGT